PIPKISPAFEEVDIFGEHGRLPERTVSSILKRAHHACHIAEGRSLQLPLAKCPRRFALEIENDEILSLIKHLAEMIIAVNPDFRSIGATVEKPFFTPDNFLLGGENLFCFLSKRIRQV